MSADEATRGRKEKRRRDESDEARRERKAEKRARKKEKKEKKRDRRRRRESSGDSDSDSGSSAVSEASASRDSGLPPPVSLVAEPAPAVVAPPLAAAPAEATAAAPSGSRWGRRMDDVHASAAAVPAAPSHATLRTAGRLTGTFFAPMLRADDLFGLVPEPPAPSSDQAASIAPPVEGSAVAMPRILAEYLGILA